MAPDLASYPAALSESARLLDQNKNQDAGNILLAALNTLVIVDHVVPLPLILAQAAISAADSQRQNKDVASPLLNTARNELNRSRAERRSALHCERCFLRELEYRMLNFGIRRPHDTLADSDNGSKCATHALISVLLFLSDRPGVSNPYFTEHAMAPPPSVFIR
jgi:hypothetical protein